MVELRRIEEEAKRRGTLISFRRAAKMAAIHTASISAVAVTREGVRPPQRAGRFGGVANLHGP